jgi:micrococcal nuclease
MIYIYKASLIRVVDGDTVELMIDQGFSNFTKQTMRLYGVDAPEMRTKEGKAAKAWLEDSLTPLEAIYVQTIQLSTKAKRDKYGRFLAVLYDELPTLIPIMREPIQPSSINDKMVIEGHAKERYW